jgi:hypothetical protein
MRSGRPSLGNQTRVKAIVALFDAKARHCTNYSQQEDQDMRPQMFFPQRAVQFVD